MPPPFPPSVSGGTSALQRLPDPVALGHFSGREGAGLMLFHLGSAFIVLLSKLHLRSWDTGPCVPSR